MQKGSKHKPESLEVIKEKMRKRWENVSPEDRSKMMKERRLKTKEIKHAV